MFCTKCGKEIPDNTVCDCEQQAQQQPQQPPVQQQQPPPVQQQYQQPQQPPPQQQQFQQQPPQQQQFQQPQQPPVQQQQFQQQPPPPQQQYQPPQQQFQQQPPPVQQQYQQPQQPPPQQQQFQQPQYQQQPPQYNMPPAIPKDNRKLFSILAYIPGCFLFGMLSSTKNDQRVRFNVGQGIMLSIYFGAMTILTIVLSIVFDMVLRVTIVPAIPSYEYFGMRYPGSPAIYGHSWVAGLLCGLLWLIAVGSTAALAIISIINVNKNQDKPLPVIGGMAFYK